MPKVIRTSFSDKPPDGLVAVIVQEGTLVIDLTDEFRTKELNRPTLIQVAKEDLNAIGLEDIP